MKEKMAEGLKKLKEKFVASLSAQKTRRLYIAAIIIAAVLIIITTVCGIYVNDYYRADGEAISDYLSRHEGAIIYELRSGVTVFRPEGECEVGLIFYPGGKVEADSYIPLMEALAERGVVAVLCEMPFNLAVLNVNAADGIAEALPEVEHWYVGGHSLGGSMAASYAASHSYVEGVVLLGAYSTADLSDKRVLSVYGSEDRVMNREKYESYKGNLPADLSETVIEGGNHAEFGMYGEQAGDGVASISAERQIDLTAEAVSGFIVK